jgi:hypothetical protein
MNDLSYNYALELASENGHAKIVHMLLQVVDEGKGPYYDYLLQNASANGHAEVVRILKLHALNRSYYETLGARES